MGRFVTNRGDVENGIKQGNWIVAFCQSELTESDALDALVATGISIYTGDPAVVIGYLDALLTQTIDGMEAAIEDTLSAEIQSQVENFAIPVIKNFLMGKSPGESTETLGSFGVKAGLAKFIGHNEEWNPIANPGNPFNAGAWQQYGPGLVSYCPYVGIRLFSNNEVVPIRLHWRSKQNTGGEFQSTGGGWRQVVPGHVFDFAQNATKNEYVELYDPGRTLFVRLYNTKAQMQWPGHAMADEYEGYWE